MKLKDIVPGSVVYLAAPYTGSKKEIQRRIAQFCRVDEYLMHNCNLVTVSPLSKHMIFMHNPDSALGSDWAYWENYSKSLLNICDVLIVIGMDGWDESKGVAGELDFANDHNIPIILLNADGTEKE